MAQQRRSSKKMSRKDEWVQSDEAIDVPKESKIGYKTTCMTPQK
jgi:hypothetical protein